MKGILYLFAISVLFFIFYQIPLAHAASITPADQSTITYVGNTLLHVSIADGTASGSVVFRLTSTNELNPDVGYAFIATEIAPGTGIFQVDVPLVPSFTPGGAFQYQPGDYITINYNGQTSTIFVNSSTGVIVKFDHTKYNLEQQGFVTVINQTANLNPNAIDQVVVHLGSGLDDTPPPGINITLNETAPNSGVFTNIIPIQFSSQPDNSTGIPYIVQTFPGDEVGVAVLGSPLYQAFALINAEGDFGVFPNSADPVRWNSDSYKIDETGSLKIFDVNLVGISQNTISAKVYSSADATKRSITLVKEAEGRYSTQVGIKFITGNSDFTTNPSVPKLKVVNGGTITAEYTLFGTSTLKSKSSQISSSGIPSIGTSKPPGVAATCTGNPPDADGDGICDSWELQGSTNPNGFLSGLRVVLPNGVGTYSYPCRPLIDDTSGNPTTASDPTNTLYTAPTCPSSNTKDIFLEIDYMSGHKPSRAALAKVVDSFKNAPVTNTLIGTTANPAKPGITLHIQLDEIIGHETFTPIIPTPGQTISFDEIKQQHFGTTIERTGVLATVQKKLEAKLQIFHYMLIAHSLSSSSASGWSEIGGNDAIISLGSFDGNGVGTDSQLEATIMHELGHNLGLNHGGSATDALNCKVNYISVMNYLFQFADLVTGRALDYSGVTYPTIDETHLNENIGIGLPGKTTAIGGVDGSGNFLAPKTISTGIAYDLNRGGGSLQTSVSMPLHAVNIPDCNSKTPYLKSDGHNDWASLTYNMRGSEFFTSGRYPIHQDLNVTSVNIMRSLSDPPIPPIPPNANHPVTGIKLNPSSGPLGTIVTVTGENFTSSKKITISFNDTVVATNPPVITSTPTGTFTATFAVPLSTPNQYVVSATNTTSGLLASANFTVTPQVFPITVMNDTASSFASLISAPRQFIGELATPTSVLVGKPIDSITLKLQKVGSPTGTAQIGIFDINRNVVKLFGTIDVSTISKTPTDYEFKLLATDPLYSIQSGDRIGFKFTGGISTDGVNVTPDRDPTDPFDGANSYRVRYESSWITSPTEDMYMILKQTHGITSTSPGISINDISLAEGNSGTKNFNFTVTRSGNTTGTSSVNYTTSDGTATLSNSDYVSKSGKLIFAPGQTTMTVTVLVNGDTTVEPNEKFNVNLSNCAGCTILDNQGVGIILNDDTSSSYPIIVMSDTTASFNSLISSPRPFIGEYVSPTSKLIGKPIDSMTLRLEKVGSPTGFAQVGIFDANRNVVKLFGTIDVSTISSSDREYEFKLPGTDPLYVIKSGDKIGFKYTGGSSTVGIGVTPDRDSADPFDGNNSYRIRYESNWISSPTEDMYMILKQTHG